MAVLLDFGCNPLNERFSLGYWLCLPSIFPLSANHIFYPDLIIDLASL